VADLLDRSTVLADWDKQILTLSSAAIALTATFSTGLVGTDASTAQLWAIGAAAALLLTSTVLALIGLAYITSYLKKASKLAALANPTPEEQQELRDAWNKAVLPSNVSFFAFAAALGALVTFGAFRVSTQPIDATSAVAVSTKFLVAQGKIQSASDWTSFKRLTSTSGDVFEVVFTPATGKPFTCTVSAKTGELTGC
jgi:hypothetical protein